MWRPPAATARPKCGRKRPRRASSPWIPFLIGNQNPDMSAARGAPCHAAHDGPPQMRRWWLRPAKAARAGDKTAHSADQAPLPRSGDDNSVTLSGP